MGWGVADGGEMEEARCAAAGSEDARAATKMQHALLQESCTNPAPPPSHPRMVEGEAGAPECAAIEGGEGDVEVERIDPRARVQLYMRVQLPLLKVCTLGAAQHLQPTSQLLWLPRKRLRHSVDVHHEIYVSD